MGSRLSKGLDGTPPILAANGGSIVNITVPTFTAPETRQMPDKIVLNPLKQFDTIQRGDSGIKLNPLKLNDTLQRGDAFKLPTSSVKPPETLQRGEIGQFGINWAAQNPSGTPNSDSWGDAWIDGLVANQGVNHGTTSPIQVANVTSATETRGLVEIDLTRFTGFTGAAGIMGGSGFQITASTTSLTAVNVNLEFCTMNTRPFTESTVAWNTSGASSDPPFGSTSQFTLTQSLPGSSTNHFMSFALNNTQINAILGKWVVILCKADATSLGYTFISREASVPSHADYYLFIEVQR